MSELKLISDFGLDAISLSNIYIDEYMPANNESQMKIYLYLLRNISTGISVSVSSIADEFNYSVSDVEKALLFMQKQGLLKLEDKNGSVTGLRILPLSRKQQEASDSTGISNTIPESNMSVKNAVAIPEVPKHTGVTMMNFETEPEIKEVIFVAEQYIGKTLSSSDINDIRYIYETLGLPGDVLEYLIEYCVSMKKKSFSYIKDVANDWAGCGIKTVSAAKAFVESCPNEVYDVFNAFGIKAGSRKPSCTEVLFVNKWMDKLGFNIDVISKACEITIDRTHSVSFEYADAILTDWNKKGVHTLADAENASRTVKKQSGSRVKGTSSSRGSRVKLANQRDYDYDELERMLINK